MTEYQMGFYDAMKEWREKCKPRWISVEERLPETQVDVLLFVKHESGGTNFVAVGSRAQWTPNRYYIGAVTTAIDADCVTHWMPLPKPPKEE